MKREVSEELLVFKIEQRFFGLAVSAVERVQRAVEVSPLPDAPAGIRGVINVHGRMIPVIDLLPLSGMAVKPIRASDQFILAQSPTWKVAIVADEVLGVIERDESQLIVADEIVPGLASIRGATQFQGEVVVIYDLDRLLSKEVATALDALMSS